MDNDQPEHLEEELAQLRQQTAALELPSASYAGIGFEGGQFSIAIINDGRSATLNVSADSGDKGAVVLDWIRQHTESSNAKIVGAGLVGSALFKELGSRLWLEEDIVPFYAERNQDSLDVQVQEAAWEVGGSFDELGLIKVPLLKMNEVGVGYMVDRKHYQETVPVAAWDRLLAETKRFGRLENQLLFINATPQGGGVALMRHALIRLCRLLEVDVRWHVMQPSSEVFEITKTKFHNVLQNVAAPDVGLTEEDEQRYLSWAEDNAKALRPVYENSRVVVIDDPQPSGLVPFIKEYNSRALIVYRSHIHLDNQLLVEQGSQARRTWDFVWGNAGESDVFISHPVAKFIPDEVVDKTLTMPATTDPLDGLNKELNERQMKYYLGLFNKIALEHGQVPLDLTRPYFIQIARFDPSKGIPDVLNAFAKVRERYAEGKAPQLVLTGHGSIDDPDGVPIYNMVLQLLQRDRYKKLAADVKVVRLHHNDQILNALLRDSYAVLQLSHKEGFEIKVTEALHKGKPVIAYRTGGIPLQIRDGETGFLIDVANCDAVADKMQLLLTDRDLYARMSRAAKTTLSPHYFTVYNTAKWLYLANELASGKVPVGERRAVAELMGDPIAQGSLHL